MDRMDISAALENKFDNGTVSIFGCVAKRLANMLSRDTGAALEKKFENVSVAQSSSAFKGFTREIHIVVDNS
jgi:hypothetical protein